LRDARRGEGVGRLSDTRYPIGKYGAGTLWYERNKRGQFILFNSVKIAVKLAGLRHPGAPLGGTWISLEPEWKVTAPFGFTELWVQHRDNEGVVISIHGGTR
jgi:hypothetical protein